MINIWSGPQKNAQTTVKSYRTFARDEIYTVQKETGWWQRHLQYFGYQKYWSCIVRGEDADLNTAEGRKGAQINEGSTVSLLSQ